MEHWSGTINATPSASQTLPIPARWKLGIKVNSNGTGSHTTLIRNNIVHQTNEVGIFLQANDSMVAANGGQGVFNATIIGNTVDTPMPQPVCRSRRRCRRPASGQQHCKCCRRLGLPTPRKRTTSRPETLQLQRRQLQACKATGAINITQGRSSGGGGANATSPR